MQHPSLSYICMTYIICLNYSPMGGFDMAKASFRNLYFGDFMKYVVK